MKNNKVQCLACPTVFIQRKRDHKFCSHACQCKYFRKAHKARTERLEKLAISVGEMLHATV